MWTLQNDKEIYIQNRNRLPDIENKLMGIMFGYGGRGNLGVGD